jgi:hypothetical protein
MLIDIKSYFAVSNSLPPKSRLLVTRITHGTVTSGPFVAGETITGGSSKKTAVIDSVESGTTLVIHTDGGLTTGEVITGGTSSASATMVGVPAAYSHKGSAVNLAGYQSATVLFSVGAVGTASTAAPTIEESSNGTTGWAEIDSARLNGTPTTVTTSNVQYRILHGAVTVAPAFVVGETITGGSSAKTATVASIPQAGMLIVTGPSGTFTNDEVLTGGTSKAVATMSGNLLASYVQTIGLTDIAAITKKYVRPVYTIAGSNAILCSAQVIKGDAVHGPAGGSSTILIG